MHNSSHPAGSATVSDLSRIAQDLQIRKVQVENVVQLLDEGNTVPFITRYRKERTGGLNEEVIRRVQQRILQSRQLAERKQTILKSIEGQGKLTEPLREAILAADNPKRLEDLYLPFKPKKKSLATDARDKGLEPLAIAIWTKDPAAANLADVLPGMLNPEKQLNTADDVLAGVGHILAEQIAEMADVRGPVRLVMWDTGELVSAKADNITEEQGKDFRDYFAFRESVRFIPAHRILAINRGEKENVLKAKVEWHHERLRAAAVHHLSLADHLHREFLEKVVDDALARLVLPSIEREIRRELTEHAQDSAVHIFARNLRSLLLQPPLRGKRVLAIDPGLRTGCKIAAIDANGNLLEESVIYPHAPHNKKAEAKSKLEQSLRKHQLAIIAIGNGTACRETEQMISELIADLDSGKTSILPDPPPAPPAPPPPPPVAAAKPAEATPPMESVTTFAEGTTAPAASEAAPSATASEAAPAPTAVNEAVPSVAADAPAPVVEVPAQTPEPVSSVVAVAPPVEAPAPLADGRGPDPAPHSASLPDAPKDVAYVIVNEAGASDYSASPIAREEFPGLDATTRGTISIGRRLQDPLAELVKIDPQHVGVGLYQHDVRAKYLKESLEAVIESCVNEVGVEINTASVPLLRHVSGLNQLVARDLVEYRAKNGPFRNRGQLKEVPGIGEARYTQAAGFLKFPGGDDPLDATWIHPESYELARQLLAELGFVPADLRDKDKLDQIRAKLPAVNAADVAARMHAGEPTVHDVLDALAKPGRDPRDDRPPPIFKKGILKLEDLNPGMELKGTVLNVVPFGAFVDIGLKDTGLVHISQMANRYIKNPYEVVAVGDVVTVWVLKVENDRRRASLTMIAPGSERKPPERRPAEPRAPQQPREPRGDRPPGDRPPRSREPGGPPHQRADGPSPRQHQSGNRAHSGDRPPPRGGPRRPPHGAPARGGPPHSTASAPPQPPPPPPRKPAKPKPLPKLSQEALKGKAPLHTFGELEAFFKAKDAPPPPMVEAPPPPPPMVEVPAPPPPMVEAPAPPPPSVEPVAASNHAAAPVTQPESTGSPAPLASGETGTIPAPAAPENAAPPAPSDAPDASVAG
jgi:protein Tex